jgi:predicted metal-binding protein
MRNYDSYRDRALALGASWARAVPASYVQTAPWVRYKCRFGCSCYDRRHICPPRTPTPAQTAEMIKSYRTALLLAFDFKGASGHRARRRKMHRVLLALEREIFLDGYYRAQAFGAGPCNLCAECELSEPCKKPGEPRPSMEACGIDVFATMANAGCRLNVVRDENDAYKLCGMVLIE